MLRGFDVKEKAKPQKLISSNDLVHIFNLHFISQLQY